MKIAWFTPFNPKSAIGHYSEAICQHLAGQHEVTVCVADAPDAAGSRPTTLSQVFPQAMVREAVLELVDASDVAVYNMGDHAPYHREVFKIAIRRPGVVILHDLVLRDFFFGYLLTGRPDGRDLYVRHLAYCHGEEGRQLGRDHLEGRKADAIDAPDRLQMPAFRSSLYRALAVIVHSEYTRSRVAEAVSAPVARIDFPIFGPTSAFATLPPRPPRGERARLLTFGMLNPNKLVHAILDAIGRSEYLRNQVEYTVIGSAQASYHARLQGLIDQHGLHDRVHLAGWRSDEELRQELLRADVVLNLRNPHLGESSASLLDSLLAGVATMVWNHGFYAEFPDDVVCKISSEEELGGALELLCRNQELRERMGTQARQHALGRFNVESYTEHFHRVIEQARRDRPVFALADRASELLLEQGTQPPEGLIERLANEIAVFATPLPEAVAAGPFGVVGTESPIRERRAA